MITIGRTGRVTFGEDASTSRTGSGPANLATIRAAIIAAIKDAGYLHIPEGRRDHTTLAETLRLHGLDQDPTWLNYVVRRFAHGERSSSLFGSAVKAGEPCRGLAWRGREGRLPKPADNLACSRETTRWARSSTPSSPSPAFTVRAYGTRPPYGPGLQ
jgi:hypothetical protein